MAIAIEDVVQTTREVSYELDDGQSLVLSVGTPCIVYNLHDKVARVEINTVDITDPEAQRLLRGYEGIYAEIALEALEVKVPAHAA